MAIYKVGKNLKNIGRSGYWADTLEDAQKILEREGHGYHVYRLAINKRKDMIYFKRVD